MNYCTACHMLLNAKNVDTNTAPSPFEGGLSIVIQREGGLKASFSFPTEYLETTLENFTLVLNALGYTYIAGLEAIGHGEEDV